MLHIVATSVGNDKDITTRSLEILSRAECLICESLQVGRHWQKKLNLTASIYLYNEHTTKNEIQELLKIVISGKNIALISDAGTPNLADPGCDLIFKIFQYANQNKITPPITAIPGASSVAIALSLCPFDMRKFIYVGFLKRQSDQRKQELKLFAKLKKPLVILDTPYRLRQVIKDVYSCIKPDRLCFLALELTTEKEELHMLTTKEIYTKFGTTKIKARFVLIVSG